MSIPMYQNRGPLTITSNLDLKTLVEKSVVITGGASGLGKAYVKAFVAAGAFVTFGDINEAAGIQFAAELGGKAQFLKCDVRNWDEQVLLFEAAIKTSPHNSCDVVIANAGVTGPDALFTLDDPFQPPVKPELRTLDINLIGMIYTSKLAMHYFRRQPLDSSRDRCLIIKTSMAAYADLPGSPQYAISKYGGRALMRTLRRTSWMESFRVNTVAPWFIRTGIMSADVLDILDSQGVEFALEEDACKAMLKIASDQTVNGRTLGVVARNLLPEGSEEGYFDFNSDDYHEGDIFNAMQEKVLSASHRLAVR